MTRFAQDNIRFVHHHICGLYYTLGTHLERVYLPQIQLKSHTTINPVCFTTTLTQKFQNSWTQSLPQARYEFPLYDNVAVSGYTITYGDHKLHGVVQQKDDAKKTYQAAVDRGETAGLLEALPAGVFGVTLGNIPSKTDVNVEIAYCGELKHDAAVDGLRYNLPTSIAPRYGSYPGKPFNPNVLANGGISITIDVHMAGSAIRKIQSPSHPISVSMGALSTAESNQAAFMPSQASSTLALGTAELAQDFILQVVIDDIKKPQALLETHPKIAGQRVLMATLVPSFTLDPTSPEIVFIADQSGSMSGAKNDALKAALLVFLKSLPLGVRFNICAFGNDYKLLWPKSQAYNEDNLNTAIGFVDTFRAGYGGTEILKPITATFKARWPELPLEVILLTDGEVWAQDEVFSYINHQIRDEKVDARIFTLGIGGDVSHTLVEGIARAGNGFAQFVTQNEETDQKVIRMLKSALYAHTRDYEIEVRYDDQERMTDDGDDDFEIVAKVSECLTIDDKATEPSNTRSSERKKAKSFFDASADVDGPITGENKGSRYAHLPILDTPKVLQAPHSIPPLFPFNRTTVYLLLGPKSNQNNVKSVTLRATSNQGPLELVIPVYESTFAGTTTIHQLAARKAIQDLEEGRGWVQAANTQQGELIKTKYQSRIDEITEREAVRLGVDFQVAGKWTSFVAVDDKGKTEDVEDTVEQSERAAQPFGLASVMPKKRRVGGYVDHFPTASVFERGATASNAAFGAPASVGGGLFGSTPSGFGMASSNNVTARNRLMDCGSAASAFGAAASCPSVALPSNSSFTSPFARESRDRDRTLTASSIALRKQLASHAARRAAPSTGATQSYGAPAPSAAPAAPASAAYGNSTPPSRKRVSGDATVHCLRVPPAQRDSSSPSDMDEAACRFLKDDDSSSDEEENIANAGNRMHALINLQTFSGAWSWCGPLFASLGISEGSVDMAKLDSASRDVCATALAVAFLETKLVAKKDVWEMVVAKARQWLGSQVGKDANSLVAKAGAML